MKIQNGMWDIDVKGLLYGTHVGEHSFAFDDVCADIREAVEERGMNFVAIRTPREIIPEQYFYDFARYLSERGVYFFFFYTVQRFFYNPPHGRQSQFTPEMIAKIKQIAGKYFLGDMFGEMGSVYACKSAGYYVPGIHAPMLPQDARTMYEAKQNFVNEMRKLIEVDTAMGIDRIASVEATMLHPYTIEAGVNLPIAELMLGNPEEVLPALRGTAKAYDLEVWGTYIAHEWYAGYRHDDKLKAGRLELCYKYAYMQGTKVMCLESGDKEIDSYGDHRPATSALSRKTYDFVQKFRDYAIDTDERPEGGPRVRVAFIQGNDDGYGSWSSGATAWAQFDREAWGHNGAEHSWRLLRDVAHKREWWEADHYEVGGRDVSNAVPMGAYDILPATAPVHVMKNYDLLVFLGWNTMSDELYARLTEYVKGGGRLLCTAAHLNTNAARDGKPAYPNRGDLSELFGCRFTGGTVRSALGIKFYEESIIPGVKLPVAATRVCDPLFAGGYTEYVNTRAAGGQITGMANDSFWDMSPIEENENRPVSHAGVMDLSGVAAMRAASPNYPAVIENKCGEGYTMLVCTSEHPGAAAVQPLYRAMLSAMLRAVAESDPVRVSAPATLRYTVWGENADILYLLNTDFDVPAAVQIEKDGKRHFVVVPPLVMRKVSLANGEAEVLNEI